MTLEGKNGATFHIDAPISPARGDYVEGITQEMRKKGITNPLIYAAFKDVDRLPFVPLRHTSLAYQIDGIQLSETSSISQPVLVADMMNLANLSGKENVLEIGTASGYSAALLSKCADQVTTLEYDKMLAENAKRVLALEGYDNISVHAGDGLEGFEENAPYDSIIVTAGAKRFPPTLMDQLADGGSMVIPVGPDPVRQMLYQVKREGDSFIGNGIFLVNFVPLFSDHEGGWSQEETKISARVHDALFQEMSAVLHLYPPEEVVTILRSLTRRKLTESMEQVVYVKQAKE